MITTKAALVSKCGSVCGNQIAGPSCCRLLRCCEGAVEFMVSLPLHSLCGTEQSPTSLLGYCVAGTHVIGIPDSMSYVVIIVNAEQ